MLLSGNTLYVATYQGRVAGLELQGRLVAGLPVCARAVADERSSGMGAGRLHRFVGAGGGGFGGDGERGSMGKMGSSASEGSVGCEAATRVDLINWGHLK